MPFADEISPLVALLTTLTMVVAFEKRTDGVRLVEIGALERPTVPVALDAAPEMILVIVVTYVLPTWMLVEGTITPPVPLAPDSEPLIIKVLTSVTVLANVDANGDITDPVPLAELITTLAAVEVGLMIPPPPFPLLMKPLAPDVEATTMVVPFSITVNVETAVVATTLETGTVGLETPPLPFAPLPEPPCPIISEL